MPGERQRGVAGAFVLGQQRVVLGHRHIFGMEATIGGQVFALAIDFVDARQPLPSQTRPIAGRIEHIDHRAIGIDYPAFGRIGQVGQRHAD
ncbi:MAG: hypothetical protein COW48_04820, partial [Hydrogenophilales bacterium CG17_big_fil_post_rev_8_21_14_2_50_63_12]